MLKNFGTMLIELLLTIKLSYNCPAIWLPLVTHGYLTLEM